MKTLLAWLRVALSDLRGDVRRFGILIACLALGVGTIAIVGSVGTALQSALARDARLVLGGDLEAQLSYRAANADERALFNRLGRTSEVIEVMGRAQAGDNSAFLALRGVDAAFPLLGAIEVLQPQTPGAGLAQLLAPVEGVYGIIPGPLLLDRLHLAVGDTVTIGGQPFAIRGILGTQPDAVTQGVALGIPALLSVTGLEATRILEPGVIARYRYKMLLADPDLAAATAAIQTAFPSVGWQVRTPSDATDNLARFFDIFSRFLVVVGLSSLLVGGVGVSSAVGAYVTERQRSIATMRALGATGARILVHFLAQILLLTLVGVAIGLVAGAGLTLLGLPILGNLLNMQLPPTVDLSSLAIAGGFGLLIGFAFAYLPLKRAERLKPALLFRSAGASVEGGLRWRDYLRPGVWLPLLVALALVFQLAVISTGRPGLVAWYAAGVVGAFIVLRGAALVLQAVLRLVPPLPSAHVRNALKTIYRPGSPAPVVILSLGLGLALLLLIALIDNNLRRQLDNQTIPDAPSFVFMDLFDDEVASLAALVGTDPGVEKFTSTALLKGAIESINGVPVAQLPKPPRELDFIYDSEIMLTAAAALPERSTLTGGEWWEAGHSDSVEVSVFDRLREPLGLKIGDQIAFRIFGEPVAATIASFRDFAWRDGGVNFAFILSPDVLELFPVSYLGLLKAKPGSERAVQQRLIADFPDTIFVAVSDALDAFAKILSSVTSAVEAIGGLAVVSGLFVLAGAMAAGRRQREADAVVMKVLGATRGEIVRAFIFEYGLLGALSALIAAGLGLVGTWAFVEFVLELDFSVDVTLIGWVVLAAIVLTIAVGVVTTWSALSTKPSSFLREE